MVAIKYHITTLSPSIESHFVTRLMIDGSEDIIFRSISGNTVFHANSAFGFISLSAGKH